MAKKISGSVGKGGKNKAPDVTVVQELLNSHTKAGGFSKLKVDGKVGTKTTNAISSFQTNAMGFKKGDGRVDVGKNTFKALSQSPKQVAAAPPADKGATKKDASGKEIPAEGSQGGKPGSGKITGKKQGVKPEIIAFVQAVADFYSTTININSGLRSPTEQGEVMWEYWVSNLKRGDLYSKIKSDRELSKKLNELYDAGNKREFIKIIARDATAYSRHVRGMAIDVPKNTPSKVRAALSTGLRELVESKCIHYDNQNKTTPTGNAVEKLKSRWKK